MGILYTRILGTYNTLSAMKKIELNGHRVQVYDSIDELPIVRFHRYNKMLLVDAGVGSDISDFDSHIERVVRFIRNKDTDNAAKELDNLRQNVYLILQEQGVRDLSFACLVHSIDGEVCEDMSEQGLAEILHTLGGAPRKDIAGSLDSVKKKIDGELMMYFPDLFDDVEVREYYDNLKRRTVAILQNISEGESEQRQKLIDRLTDKMVLYVKPKVFSGSGSVEIQHDKSFESLCLTIQKETGADPKRMTVLEYYNAYEYLRKMSKERQKAVAKRR